MNILVVGKELEKRELWKGLLSNSLMPLTVHTCIEPTLLFNGNSRYYNVVICLTAKFDDSVQLIFDQSIAADIPVLCITDDINETEYNNLIQSGIKGILNSNIATLNSIKNAIRIVNNGGLYIESRVKNNNLFFKAGISSGAKPSLDMEEWNVFSLTSKGFTVSEIANQLQIANARVLHHQTKIIEKTKSKTMSGAVANGIHKGWLLNKY